MLSNKIKAGFVALVLAASPALAVAQEVFEGGWEDGATILWQCQKGAQGKTKFQITLPDGKIYQGTLSCGTSV